MKKGEVTMVMGGNGANRALRQEELKSASLQTPVACLPLYLPAQVLAMAAYASR